MLFSCCYKAAKRREVKQKVKRLRGGQRRSKGTHMWNAPYVEEGGIQPYITSSRAGTEISYHRTHASLSSSAIAAFPPLSWTFTLNLASPVSQKSSNRPVTVHHHHPMTNPPEPQVSRMACNF